VALTVRPAPAAVLLYLLGARESALSLRDAALLALVAVARGAPD
jgi:hypothetical protein